MTNKRTMKKLIGKKHKPMTNTETMMDKMHKYIRNNKSNK